MSKCTYLLAKYIGDLRRFEPKNIGVIVLTEQSVAGRFVAERSAKLGEVDGRSIPSFVSSASSYRQWISYWRDLIQRGVHVRN